MKMIENKNLKKSLLRIAQAVKTHKTVPIKRMIGRVQKEATCSLQTLSEIFVLTKQQRQSLN